MRILNIFCLLSCILLFNACTRDEVLHRGYNFDKVQLEALTIGQTNNQQLVDMLGSPTTVSNFGKQTYYYISGKYQMSSFSHPELIDQQILAFTFDKSGILTNMAQYDGKNFKAIEVSDNKIAIPGNTLSAYEQIAGNVGRYQQRNK